VITVSMDVHVRNSFLHATDVARKVLCHGRCSNTLLDIGAFLAPVEREARVRQEPLHVVLESTTNSRGMARMLATYGREAGIDLTVDVLDARRLRVIAESVCKTDAVDARVLNELACSNLRLPVCYLPDDEEFALREHLRARSDLVRIRTMFKNRVHALLHRRAILTPQADLFAAAGREFLRQLSLDEAGRTILIRYLDGVDQIDRLVRESTASLRELSRAPRWSKPVALLQTMPGVGLVTSLTILAELGNLKRFPSRAAVANYAGLIPVIRDSNEKHFAGRITRRGSMHLRAVLVEAAWMAEPRVPAYHDLFHRVQQKKGKGTAIVAVARRMLEDAYTILKKGEAFRYMTVSTSEATESKGSLRSNAVSRGNRKVASSVAG
jgi:transposase